jgi:hypothetical protein
MAAFHHQAKITTMISKNDLDLLSDAADTILGGRGKQTSSAVARYMDGNPAAQSTIDALMYSLRSGTAALKRKDAKQRIACLDERQLHACCKQLQHRRPDIAKSLSKDEVEMLVAVWAACHD